MPGGWQKSRICLIYNKRRQGIEYTPGQIVHTMGYKILETPAEPTVLLSNPISTFAEVRS